MLVLNNAGADNLAREVHLKLPASLHKLFWVEYIYNVKYGMIPIQDDKVLEQQ